MSRTSVAPLLIAAVLTASACSNPAPPADVQATVSTQVQATLAAVPTATIQATAAPATVAPTVAVTPTATKLNDADIAALGRTWLVHVDRGQIVGSGVVVSSDGYVLTNEHVVHDSGPIKVALSDGRLLYADLIGSDPEVDLALLHVSAEGLAAATFGEPSHLKQGDPVILVGYALDLPGEPSITRGVFSGRREMNNRLNLVQTDAAMNPGMSGGAMLDSSGSLVAINVARLDRLPSGQVVQNINFGIPADLARGFVQTARSGQLGAVEVAAAQATPVPSTQPGELVVNKRFGAALRASPSSDSAVLASVGCGTTLIALGDDNGKGWFQVRLGNTVGWVGGARVTAGSSPDSGACVGAPVPAYRLGDLVRAQVQTGCLSVRPTPSGSAPIAGCVPSGHVFQLINGPIEVDDEDWYAVRSTSTGLTGWTRAVYLVR